MHNISCGSKHLLQVLKLFANVPGGITEVYGLDLNLSDLVNCLIKFLDFFVCDLQGFVVGNLSEMSLGPALNQVYGRVIKSLSLAPLFPLIADGLLTDTCALRHWFQVKVILDTEKVKLGRLESHLVDVILRHLFVNLIEDLDHLLHIDIVCLTIQGICNTGALSFVFQIIKCNLGAFL